MPRCRTRGCSARSTGPRGGWPRSGVREGDRVALVAANGPALIVAFLAVVASGAAAAPLNPALGVAELTAELADLRVSRLLHDGAASGHRGGGPAGVPASVMSMADGQLQVDGEAGEAD